MSIQAVGGASPLPQRAAVPPAAAPAQAADPVDVRLSQSTPWTTGDIRRLLATPAPPADRPRVDANKLPFGVEIEMEGYNRAAAQPIIDGLEPWDVKPNLAKWSLVHDGSVPGSNSGIGGEAISPPMVLEGGRAEAQIRTVLNGLRELGARPSMACGLHIHVDGGALGPRGLANLMRMAVEQEQTLYRLSQNGQPQHRGALNTSDPFHYCKPMGSVKDPFPMLHADSADEFRNAFYTQMPSGGRNRPRLPAVGADVPFRPDRYDASRYYGVNFNSFWYRGTVEFRIFNSTDDPDKLLDDVRLAVGMVAAAANDEYTFVKSDPLQPAQLDRPVSREAFDHFLEKAVPDPATRERLTRTFVEGGGTFAEDAPVDVPVAQAARLIERGQTFSADGKTLQSPFEVASEIKARKRPVTVHTPTWSNTVKNLDDLAAVHDALDEELGGLFAAAREQGHGFLTPEGAPMPRWSGRQPMTLVRPDGARFELDALGSERMLAAVQGRPDLLGQPIQQRFAQADALTQDGVRFQDAAGQRLSPLEAAVLSETDGRVQAERDGERVSIGRRVSFDDLRTEADPDLVTLQQNGVRFRIWDREARWLPRIEGALSDPNGRLSVQTADGRTIQARSKADLNPLLVEVRRAELTPEARHAFDTVHQAARRADIRFSAAGQAPVAPDSNDEFGLITNPEVGLTATVPALASTIRLADRGQVVALAAAANVAGPTLGPVVFRHVIPALMRDVARSQHDPQASRQLSGELTVGNERFAVHPLAGQPAVQIGDLRVSLDAASRVRLERGDAAATIDPRLLSTATPGARHEVSAGLEWWTTEGDSQALFSQRPEAVAPIDRQADLGVETGHHFQACVGENSKINGYRVTNEVTTWFPRFTLRGGAYLGVGASQNYDHLTTVKADLAFLVDADPRVAADHRGMLALVGEARNPAHFLSMLMGTPLAPHEESLPLDQVFKLIETRGANADFTRETRTALSAHLTAEALADVEKLQDDARATFLSKWAEQATDEKQHRWLWEPERFAHLRYLQQSGRLVVRCASLTGGETMKSIADQVTAWNQNHYPPLTFSAVYLSNAEQWISQGTNQAAAYPALVANLDALPLHPEGVILRTGGEDIGGARPGAAVAGNTWNYASLPMGRYLDEARRDPSYATINRASRGHAAALESAQAARAQQIADALLAGLEAAGTQIEGPRQIATYAQGALTLHGARGQVTPKSFDALVRAEKWLNGRDAEIATDFLPLATAFERLRGLGYACTAGQTAISNGLTLWERLQSGAVDVERNGRAVSLRSAQALIQMACIESGHLEELDATTRGQLEALRALSAAGCSLQAPTLGAAYEALSERRLVVSTPLGRYVNLVIDDRFSERVDELRAQAARERAPQGGDWRDALTALQAVGYTLGTSEAPLSLDEAGRRLAAGALSLQSPLGGRIDVGHAEELLAHLQDGIARGREEQQMIAARGEQPPTLARVLTA